MDQQITPDQNGDMRKMLEENLAVTKELLKITKKVKNFLIWQQVFGVVKLLIIAIPIILGIIYLPPLLKEVYNAYTGLLDFRPGEDINALNSLNLDLDKINLPSLDKILNK